MHFGSPSDPSQTAVTKAKPRYIYSILKSCGQSLRRQVRLLLSKAKLSNVYFILKPHGQSSRSPVRPLLSEAKPSYVYFLKPHGQSSGSPVRQMLCEAKPSYIYWILKPLGQSWFQAVVCVRTPRMYPQSGYFLMNHLK